MKTTRGSIAIVLGTRPEIIKCAPIIDECRRRALPFFVVHTGQHYTAELDAVFFRDLHLDLPKYNLGIGSLPAGKMIGAMISGLSDVFARENPRVVLVEGDTNSVLAGAVAGHASGSLVGHVEAGLRSFDRAMPEEINRIMTDSVSDMLFAPTKEARVNLIHEGIHRKKIIVVGNSIADVVRRAKGIVDTHSPILVQYGLVRRRYAVLTLHRPSNVDDPLRLMSLMRAVGHVSSPEMKRIIFPMHPRTHACLKRSGISVPPAVTCIDPLGYLDFLALASNARIIYTDSGGIQEEACVLRVPCVTLRDSTERPETIAVGANILARPATVSRATRHMLARRRVWKNPFGDGHTAERILDVVSTYL